MRASVRCGEKARVSRAIPSAAVAPVRMVRQRFEAGRFDAAPEYARRVRIGEEPDLADMHRDGRLRFQRRQRGFQFAQPLLGPLADEFRGDMEIAGRLQ